MLWYKALFVLANNLFVLLSSIFADRCLTYISSLNSTEITLLSKVKLTPNV